MVLAASLDPGAVVVEGSGTCVPPVQVDATVCLVGDRAGALGELGAYRLLRADLALVPAGDPRLVADVAEVCPGSTLPFELVPEPVERLDTGARVALFSTAGVRPPGLEPLVASANLAHRRALEADLDRARAERCDVYLTELKAAAIDTVAARAEQEGARVVFLRNRPVAPHGDLDAALLALHGGCGAPAP